MFFGFWKCKSSVSKNQGSIYPHLYPKAQILWGYPSCGYNSQDASHVSRQNWCYDSRNVALISDAFIPDHLAFEYGYLNDLGIDNQTMSMMNSRAHTHSILPSSRGASGQKHSVHSRKTSSANFRKSYVGHLEETIVSSPKPVEKQLDVQAHHVESTCHFVECRLLEDLQCQALPVAQDCLRYVKEVQSSMPPKPFGAGSLSSSCKSLIRDLEELIKLLHWEHRCRAPGFGIHGEYIKELRISLPALKELRKKLRRRRARERWQQVLNEAQSLVNTWVQRLKEAQDENPDWYQSLSPTRHLNQFGHFQQLKRTEILAHSEQKDLKRIFRHSYRT